MLQNTYNLSDLVELSLKVPEVGAVNFNILYIVLQTIISELNLTELRPWCQIENPVLAKAALTRAKLKDVHRTYSDSSVTVPTPKRDVRRSSSSDATMPLPQGREVSLSTVPEKTFEDQNSEEPAIKSLPQASQTELKHLKDSETQSATKIIETPSQTVTEKEEDGNLLHKDSQTDTPQASQTDSHQASQTGIDQASQTELYQSSQTNIIESKDAYSQSSTEINQTGIEETPEKSKVHTESQRSSQRPRPKPRREAAGWDEVTKQLKDHKKTIETDDSKKTTAQDLKQVKAAWQYTNLETRVEATEEGLMRLTDIVDMITDKIRKAEARRKPGGPSSAELEAIEDRIIDLEEGREVWDFDHDVLEETESLLSQMQKEFEVIKSLGNELNQMKNDISTKADKQETEDALSLKADLTLVNMKVDQVEFETAIEELGEAIGLLGLKFQKKNSEWEERASELWDAVNSKMTRDIFEKARMKTEERLTALMFGLKKLKKVVEDLLYPDSGGVTRCIACRRPADISGHKCINIIESPKRQLKSSDENSYDGLEKIEKTIDSKKRRKLDGPPFGVNKDIKIRVPYCSSTYNSSTDDSDIAVKHRITLSPTNRSVPNQNVSDTPKLPSIMNDVTIDQRTEKASIIKHGRKSQHKPLKFTNRRKKEEDKNAENVTSYESENYSLPSNVLSKLLKQNLLDKDIIDDSARNIQNFPPIRMIKDPMRKDILLSSTAPDQHNLKMILSPLQNNNQEEIDLAPSSS